MTATVVATWLRQSRWLLLPLLSTLVVAACQPAPRTQLPHEAYIWQRLWTDDLRTAMHENRPRFAGWRVLGLQWLGGELIEVEPDLDALAASALPVRLVLRMEGSRAVADGQAIGNAVIAAAARWRAAGTVLIGVEIDHDCARAGLAQYAAWLAQLRSQLPPDLELSITALPSWIGAPELANLLRHADHSVLQVHAVDNPERGLFDPAQARAWTQGYAALQRPFRVALPAYGLRVAQDRSGQVRAVDAEADIEISGAAGRELRVDPQALAQYLQAMRGAAPASLQGYLWFRLPTARDRRAISVDSLAAVIAADPLAARFELEARASGEHLFDLWLHNRGNLDAPPASLVVPAGCPLAEALGGYRVRRDGNIVRLLPAADAWLPAGQRRRIGWARCVHPSPPETWILE